MPGAILIVIILLLIPVAVLMGGAVVAVILGSALNDDVNRSHEGSELIETNY
jgi:sensor domain CHASE-containing protein